MRKSVVIFLSLAMFLVGSSAESRDQKTLLLPKGVDNVLLWG